MAKVQITIVGLGQIGASLGLALKRARADIQVVGHDRDGGAAAAAAKRGAVDKTEWNLINACEGASLIILAIPLKAIPPTLTAMSKYLEPGQLITDTAATKAPVMQAAKLLPSSVAFVGGHPVIPPARPARKPDRAKKESPAPALGPEDPDPDLFQNAIYCLVPGESAGENAIQTMTGLVSLVGAKPYFVDALEHDSLIAGVQNLPLVQALALLAANVESPSWRDMSKLASTDFFRATEPADGDPAALAETLLANREALVHWIDTGNAALLQLRELIARGDAKAMEAVLGKLRDTRLQWLTGETEGASVMDSDELRNSTMRLFLGGLARERKRP